MNKTVMLVEDEFRMRILLRDYFKKEQFEVIEAEDGEKALNLFLHSQPDVIIMDIMMPKLDGFSLCRAIREKSTVPIIILTAKSQEEDKLLGYELGADEYVTKPFSPKVLIARTIALLKRANGTLGSENSISVGSLKINIPSREVSIKEDLIQLSTKEFNLLLYMVKNKNIVLTRDMLLDNVWGYDYEGDYRTVDTSIKRLREKLGACSQYIHTIRGLGYKFYVE
ncbi:DNA-binding response regulator, OmpR family, contains REC and winged-helix (wHTH) domain [Hathewaya proteolytica DSM 3090]|uniref:Stage 0 sporulation protein A homolog n=1 Tax=Hathewaya proteolytica DSM 3090 TaxID=1121331 RepID=A0A1M6T500_9CLOT|nr:response regulator transcription factor [Hathewaya proteolytica]SHK52031.1 DNA-binding response regulator, OmpR family, contains REC and winged-helix (wHTH) domain [Hathewaya proteolytica DSM 3090]